MFPMQLGAVVASPECIGNMITLSRQLAKQIINAQHLRLPILEGIAERKEILSQNLGSGSHRPHGARMHAEQSLQVRREKTVGMQQADLGSTRDVHF
jgi:hypothetical protein